MPPPPPPLSQGLDPVLVSVTGNSLVLQLFVIDFLKVLLIFFPGCSDRASLASLAKNLWEVDLPQLLLVNGTVFHEMPLWNTFHKGKALPALKS